jgi:hypothetical protein
MAGPSGIRRWQTIGWRLPGRTRAAAMETLLERLRALNAGGVKEEAVGTLRSLRPEF